MNEGTSMVMSAYRLGTHSNAGFVYALPYVSLVNDKTVKRTGVLPLKPFNNRDLTGVVKCLYSRRTTACPKQ